MRPFTFVILPLLAPVVYVNATPVETGIASLAQRIEQRGPETTAVVRRDDPYDPHISIPPVSIPPVTEPSLSLDLPSNTCTPTVKPDKNGYVPPDQCNALYQYYPSFGAAIAFSVVFGIIMMTHFVQATIYKTGFVWVILMGAAWEFTGFLTRALSTKKQQDWTLATMTQLFVLLAPLWVNAFDYMVLARMIHFFLPDRRIGIFKPSLLAMIFVVLDFGSFIVQLIGGSMAGPGQDQDAMMKGVHIYMAGIGVQEFFIVLFLILAVQFHRRMHRLDAMGALVGPKTHWKGLIYALYGSLLAITVRIIYRLVEFANGNDPSNPIPYHEWYMYVFDAVPMMIAIIIWSIAHPGKVLQGPDAKLPPSGLRRICCCCCGRRRKHQGMQKVESHDADAPYDQPEEILPFRHRAV